MNYPVVKVTKSSSGKIQLEQNRFLTDPDAVDPGKYPSPYKYAFNVDPGKYPSPYKYAFNVDPGKYPSPYKYAYNVDPRKYPSPSRYAINSVLSTTVIIF